MAGWNDFEFCFEHLIGHEGGFTNHRSDPGNWTGGRVGSGRLLGTKYGIAANSFPNIDIPNLTLNHAKRIYYENYWQPSGADLCLPGASLLVFDAAVNTGVRRAKIWLQRAAGTSADGIIGPNTRAAVYQAMRTDPKKFAHEFHSQRTWHHMKLSNMVNTFGLGWSRRLVDLGMVAGNILDAK